MEPCGVLKSFQAGVTNIYQRITLEKLSLFPKLGTDWQLLLLNFTSHGRVTFKLFSIEYETVKQR